MALPAELAALVAKSKAKHTRASSRLKPKEGINRYRLLINDTETWKDLGVHWIKSAPDTDNPKGKVVAVIGSRDVVYDEPCPIATAVDRAIASAVDEESKKIFEEWKVRKSVLINALDRSKGSENPNDPQILELTTTTFAEVLGIVQQYADADQNVFDISEGVDIVITKSGKGLNTKYAVNTAPGVSQPVPAETLNRLANLQEHIETEFFKGEDRKALNAIAAMAGVSVAGLLPNQAAAPAAIAQTQTRTTSAPALTAAGAVADGADEAPATPAAPAAGAMTTATTTASAPVTPAAVETPAAPAAPVAPVAAAPVDMDDLDSILAGLDDIK